METNELNSELLAFFKALADENRLKIVGLLAQREFSVEELAETLNLGVSTTSHHLAKLTKAGLASARGWALLPVFVEDRRHPCHVGAAVEVRNAAGTVERDQRRHLRTQGDGCLHRCRGSHHRLPRKEKKLLVILRYAVNAFEMGRRYSEKEVNEILLRFNKDTAFMRRSFIEYKLMAREGGGGAYWRI
jgi:hypothetical protein